MKWRRHMRSSDIYAELLNQVEQGFWNAGDKLPTERELAEHYKVSRPTISRVLNQLRDLGVIERVIGSGTYLTALPGKRKVAQKTFGLFVPGLGRGEIFEPICTRIAELSHEYDFSLIWGSIPSENDVTTEERLYQTAQRFIDGGLDGIFLQPVEREPGLSNKNLRIASMFEDAGIALVLLDSDFLIYPERSRHDLVGIDNIQAGLALCNHFLGKAPRRVDFLWRPNTAGTYALRLIGYREALQRAEIEPSRNYEHQGDPNDLDFVAAMIKGGARDIICVNDETAVTLIISLESLGIRVPEDVRVAGFDDLKFAQLAHVPLTTMHQPCREIGDVALNAMLSRIENPGLPPRNLTIAAELQVRKSTSLEMIQ
jgi:DNA-binding LacI/PurR family transcriptional regulator